MTQENAVEVRRLTASYSSRPVLWDVDARIPAGALAAIVGPNGAGKSTLLKAVVGLLKVDSGHVLIDGRPASDALDRIAYVPQRDEVDWDFPITVREVVEMGRYRSTGWIRRLKKSDHEIVEQSIERVGMGPFASRQIGELSGGQRQRVFIARALAQQSPVMLLDEPFAGVDARTEAALLDLLAAFRDEGRTVVVVHHDIGTVRARFDWALLLNVRTIACGPVAESLSPEMLKRAYGGIAGEDGVEDVAWTG
ncbi:MAG: metal ABC transporter ATP-binding protein [Actinomycetota bacterium]|nr:metal ABC transporter ATP-binding protein [Actinomycetota bacterium]